MKFPYELSEQRISLLSKEDQRIYRFEHSDFFDVSERQRCMQEYQNALLERQGYYVQEIKKDPQFNYLNESQVIETANELALYEANNLIDQLSNILEESLFEVIPENEVIDILNESVENLSIASYNTLNEDNTFGRTTGPDMTWWAEGLGGMFGGIMSLIIAMIMRGKTKMAIRLLENYMNEIVEKVDDGVNKTKGRGLLNRIPGIKQLKNAISKGWNKLMGRKHMGEGEQNTMSLRTIQEDFQANIATKSMVYCKKLGLLPDNWNDALQCLITGNYSQGSFYNIFLAKIANPINELGNLKVNE